MVEDIYKYFNLIKGNFIKLGDWYFWDRGYAKK